MKKFLLPSVALLLFIFPFLVHANSNLSDKLSGRILLQVEEKGEAWYIEPTTKERAFLGRPDDAFRIMRELGLGISEKDFKAFGQYAPKRLSGRIILRVEAKGQAYYVNPVDLKMYFLGRPADAFGVMRQMGLGVTNQDIERVPVFQKYAQQTDANSKAIKSLEDKLLEQNNKINELEDQLHKVPTSTPSTCSSWTYSDWSDCSESGKQYRDILTSAPINCSEGSPVLDRNCEHSKPVEYSQYLLKYRIEEYQGSKVVNGQEVEINRKGNITAYLKTSSRDIRIKKIVINVHNATPDQTVGIKYNGGWFKGNLKQINNIRWEFDTEIEVKRKNGGDEFDVHLFASGPYGLDAVIEPLFDEWEVWDYTSNKPVKIQEISTAETEQICSSWRFSDWSDCSKIISKRDKF